ncbi:NAD-dependent epimerase/dehydratase family protein [Plantactinospora siamensis]|uniref:NAD-dependent epimerase/dehydratase family protein n=1 Tax=Plantactinospora siamensis TaxID=555372 RepID=A0ABV6NXQ9_9ACTN
MRVLVTGHHGYLGSVLTPLLTAAGHEVAGLDTDLYADRLLGPPPAEVPTTRMDVRDVGPEQCAGFDAVVHLAALCNDPLGNLDPDLTVEINHGATLRLARAARAAGVPRFVFASSCSLYGAGQQDTPLTDAGRFAPLTDAGRFAPLTDAGRFAPLTEDAGFAPLTVYGETKVAAERDLLALAGDDFSPVFARNATAYGFSPRLRTDLVVNDLVAHALLTGEVRLLSDGTAWRPLVHAEDIGQAMLALLEAPREVVHGRAYNVGTTGENHLIRDVATMVAEVVDGSRVTFAAGAGTDARDYRVDCGRIAAEVPAFRPRWTLRKGIEELVEAYRRHGLTLPDVRDRYQRLARIRELRAAGRLGPGLRWIG